MRFFHWRENVRSSLWFIPSICVAGAFLLALALIEADRRGVRPGFAFEGGAESAQTFLSTISSSMITFTGLVFTITIVVLQLASQQFSPRVLRTFLRDRHSQLALGVFTATFTYSLVVLRVVGDRGEGSEPFVPELAVTGSFGLVVLSLALFVDYIHHISQSIRVGSITAAVGDETRDAIADIYDHEHVEEPLPLPRGAATATLSAPRRGVITGLDRDQLVKLAVRHDVVIEIMRAIGDYVPEGEDLIRIHGDGRVPPENLKDAVGISTERTMQQDPAFGFRQLVDIAERSLSPAINDPTTAVQCLDEIHDLLRSLAHRPFPSGQRLGPEGELRLDFPVTSWNGYISLAFDEIRQYGGGSIQVHRRLRSLLLDLLEVAPRDRHGPLRRQLHLLDLTADAKLELEEDRETAKEADEQGVGGT